MSITSNNHPIQIPPNRVQSTDSEPSNLLSLRMLRKCWSPSPAGAGDERVSPGCQLEVTPHPALQSHLVGPSNALKDALGQQGGREEYYSPAASLDLCMGVAGSLTAIPSISGFLCLLEKLYQLCYKNRKIGLEMPR